MQPEDSLRDCSPSQLAARCEKTQSDGSHEPFCFELFRRAIVEDCAISWHYLHTQYYPLVRYWVSKGLSATVYTLDDLTQDTFTAFWRFYTPDNLAQADGLGDVLAYLKSCAASTVAQAHRGAERRPSQTDYDQDILDAQVTNPSTETSALRRVNAQRLWALVEARCKNEKEHLVARLTFLAGLKPRHIAEQFPETFPDVNDVYRVKRNLTVRLRRDPTLKSYAKKSGISI
jgi:RNA polymerase sigma factor (sigma-70 family)